MFNFFFYLPDQSPSPSILYSRSTPKNNHHRSDEEEEAEKEEECQIEDQGSLVVEENEQEQEKGEEQQDLDLGMTDDSLIKYLNDSDKNKEVRLSDIALDIDEDEEDYGFY